MPKSVVLAVKEQYERSAFEVLEEDALEGHPNNLQLNKPEVVPSALPTSNLVQKPQLASMPSERIYQKQQI